MTPAQWTPRLVQQRLREAFAVEQRLPDSGRPRGLVSFWPAAPLHSFTEMLHWTDARERVWQSWAQSKGGVHPFEISRMEEAQGWLLLVEEGERRCLGVWALAAARGIRSAKCCAGVAGRSRPSTARSTVAQHILPPSWARAGVRCVSWREARPGRSTCANRRREGLVTWKRLASSRSSSRK
jgi:hypothetical protein